MNVELTETEAAALRRLLAAHLADMYGEISHTDNPGFRAQLRGERDLIKAVQAKLPS